MNFSTVILEGSLISSDLLEEIYSGEAPGQKIRDFNLDARTRLTDEIAASWSDARVYWESFKHGMTRVREGDSGATVTREQWILPLLRSMGFDDISFARKADQIGGLSYFISHRAGGESDGFPIHIEGANNDLDKRPPSGRPRLSPHALVQEYLNRSDHLWALVTNGYQLRLLRDSERLSRPTYLQFDLQQMMESELFSEFQLLYRLVHRSRWPGDVDSVHECLLESYYQTSIESGGRVREKLRDGVEAALKIFGNGFLRHPDNQALRLKIYHGELDATEYYRQLLRLIYRYLFLMVSEERRLVGPDASDQDRFEVYQKHYSISRFRSKVERSLDPEQRHWDLWEGVKLTFKLYCHEQAGTKLGVAPLNGDLFGSYSMPDLDEARLYNHDFLHGFAHLSLFRDNNSTRRINYAYLDVEELGSVYESLLDYHPIIENDQTKLQFKLATGTERKSTGSYYTRPELVQELIKSALVPVMQGRLSAVNTAEEQEKALLNLKICDPAAGSGHFLLAAARRIARELAKVRTGEEQPTPDQFRTAVRDVIQHCIYGVDLNPLAVDLCKVALWLEGHNKDKPLTFLDHHIKCGNSLVGVMDLGVLKQGIPDDAFNPVTGDDKKVAANIRRRNKKERESAQIELAFGGKAEPETSYFAKAFGELANIPDDDADRVKQKEQFYHRLRDDDPNWYHQWTAANIWTAAFFYPLQNENDPAIATHDTLMRYLENPNAAHGQMVGKANGLAAEHRFFHWQLEFPEVMNAGGFDVVLGNPPWERIKLQEQEFFSTRDTRITGAANKAARARLIKELMNSNPDLSIEFEEAKHNAKSLSRFVRSSGRFELTARGDINTYALFAEQSRKLMNVNGRAGIIVPTGIATDDTYKEFFADLNDSHSLASLFDFENKEGLFQSVHRSYKFSLLTLTNNEVSSSQFAFFLTRTEHLDDEIRRFTLSADDIALINPNTRTVPVFRTNVDAELTKKIFHRVPVFVNEKPGENPWGIKFFTMFHMSNDSHFFYTEPGSGRVPLYEAKMIWQYDHRFGSYAGVDPNSASTHLPTPTPEQYADPNYTVTPRYWVEGEEVESRIAKQWDRKWFLGFRDITNATNERTSIFTIVPYYGVGNNMPILLIKLNDALLITCLLANINSIIFDYINRQKISGTHMNFFFVRQLPVFAPQFYENSHISFITDKTLELIYNTYDLKPFAEDMGYHGEPFRWDEERRAVLRAELDAYYARLYGLSRDELRYILDPQDVYGPDFPGETFRVLKEKELKKYGEYRTRRLVLEAWDRM